MNFVHRFARNTTARVGIAGGLLTFFWRRKLWWMTPLVAMLLILVALYFVVVGPIAVIVRLVSDPLGIKGGGSAWTERRRATSLEAARRQF